MSQFFEKIISIKTVENGRDNSTLADAISETKEGGIGVAPLNICKLLSVDKKKHSDENHRNASTNELLEEETMFYKIKGFRHIHTAGEHIRAIPHELADSLDHTPSTHCGGAARLICKLELIQAKRISKEYQDNPVKQL